MRYEPDDQMLRIRRQAQLLVEDARRAGGAQAGDLRAAAELQAAAELIDVAEPPPLRPEALARIRRGVEERLAPGATREPRRWKDSAPRRRWSLSAAMAIGFVLVSAVGAGAALWRYQRLEARRADAEASAPAAAPSAKRRSTHHRATVAARSGAATTEGAELPDAVEAAPEPAPPPAAALASAGEPTPAPRNEPAPATPALAPAPSPAPRRVSPALGATPAAGDVRRSAAAADRRAPSFTPASEAPAPARSETEARMLARALAQLRQQHDPRAALATLDRLAQAFPGGVLASEALATRIEAALAMNDLATATKLVETAAPPPGRAGAALLVVRAELRARAGRCDVAAQDFTRVLDTTSTGAGDLRERALYGRAVCFGHLGQAAAARRDLAAYLRDHPTGRFSAEARRLVSEGPSP